MSYCTAVIALTDILRGMKILGIETSCDETAVAIVEDGRKILSNVVSSQIDIHAEYGGVVPEIAARSHIEVMIPVVKKALQDARLQLTDLDGIAVTFGPGLVGSLLVGALTARTLSQLTGIPLFPINHVTAHTYANFLLDEVPQFPLLSLIVSGNHSQLVLFESHASYQVLGHTIDDAAGEAFDKVAKILGLPYPGGVSVSRLAEHGDKLKYALPKPKTANIYDFSFSGLKTAVLRAAQAAAGKDFRTPSHEVAGLLTEQQKRDMAASFQYTAIQILAGKLARAYVEFKPSAVVIAGGVASSSDLRKAVSAAIPLPVRYAPGNLCTDNGAMIAALGYYQSMLEGSVQPSSVEVNPVLAM